MRVRRNSTETQQWGHALRSGTEIKRWDEIVPKMAHRRGSDADNPENKFELDPAVDDRRLFLVGFCFSSSACILYSEMISNSVFKC